MLRSLGAEPVEVRSAEELRDLDGLVIPGGESTTIAKAIERDGLEPAIRAHADAGLPILGTCAGMIVCDREHLGLVDATARRNAFGRQIASFEVELEVGGLGPDPMRAVFIRAPWIDEQGPEVEVLASVDDHPVVVRAGPDPALRLPSRAHRRLAPARPADGDGHRRAGARGRRCGVWGPWSDGSASREPGPDPGSLLRRAEGGRHLPDRRAFRRRAPDHRGLRGGPQGRGASGGFDVRRGAGRDVLQARLGRSAASGSRLWPSGRPRSPIAGSGSAPTRTLGSYPACPRRGRPSAVPRPGT